MKRIIKLAVIAIVAAVATSCGTVLNSTSNSNLLQTNVVLSGNNYTVVRQVSGTATATYWFGIGGLSRKALHNNSVATMVKRANLKGSQALVNVTTHSSIKSFAGIYSKITYTSHGTVIEFK